MRALVFDKTLSFRDDYPDPVPAEKECLVKVRYAGICSTDEALMQGYMGFKGVLGHEMVGEVVTGPDAWVGKRVACEINCVCQSCPMCQAGLSNHCPNRTVLGILNKDGCFADFVTMPVRNLHEIPDAVFDKVVARLEEKGMKISGFGSLIGNWAKKITDDFSVTEAEIGRAIPRMQRLGAKLIRVMSYAVCKTDGKDDEEQFAPERIKRMNEINKRFADASLTVVHENCMNWGGMSPTYVKRMAEAVPGMVREILSKAMFAQACAHRLIHLTGGCARLEHGFSGGERARLALALIAWRKPNVMLLDEPTNHLDLETREALAEALSDFGGAIVLVSHDRHLTGLVCNTYWRVADGHVEEFDGDLDEYAAWLRTRNNKTAERRAA